MQRERWLQSWNAELADLAELRQRRGLIANCATAIGSSISHYETIYSSVQHIGLKKNPIQNILTGYHFLT